MKKFLIIVAVLAALGGLGYYVYSSLFNIDSSQYNQPSVVTAELTQNYKNEAYGFLLKMPEDFEAASIPDEMSGGETVVLQNKSGDGIQIIISPFDEDAGAGYALTSERILQDVPDIQIKEEQSVEVGPDYIGLAFKSDNELFGGESREVWFVFRGNLYQISTYARLDPLLKAIFATWQFN